MSWAISRATRPPSGEICGRNMALGLPALLEITADFVANAIAENLKSIVDAIKVILERTPPELGVDIIRNGIFLTGGVANLKGLDKLIAGRYQHQGKSGR